jgi:hypothetical protein
MFFSGRPRPCITKALGLTVPSGLLVSADEVIE